MYSSVFTQDKEAETEIQLLLAKYQSYRSWYVHFQHSNRPPQHICELTQTRLHNIHSIVPLIRFQQIFMYKYLGFFCMINAFKLLIWVIIWYLSGLKFHNDHSIIHNGTLIVFYCIQLARYSKNLDIICLYLYFNNIG